MRAREPQHDERVPLNSSEPTARSFASGLWRVRNSDAGSPCARGAARSGVVRMPAVTAVEDGPGPGPIRRSSTWANWAAGTPQESACRPIA